MTLQEIKDFCFDVLGDFIPLNCYDVQPTPQGFRVIVFKTCGIPRRIIKEEWDRQVKGTDFEKINFYI